MKEAMEQNKSTRVPVRAS